MPKCHILEISCTDLFCFSHPELDEYSCSQRNLEEYTKRLWQQRVKTETVDINDDIDEQGGYSPTRENYYFDNYYGGDDTFREHLDYSLKRSADDQLSPSSTSLSIPTPSKRGRGRPYKEVSVKITCLRPEDNKASSLTVDFGKLQDEGLGKHLRSPHYAVTHLCIHGHVFCPVTFGYVPNNSLNVKISFL